MGFLDNFLNSCADSLLMKLSKYREFPEEQYVVAVENRKLKDELAVIKSSRYDELLEENKKIRNEIDEMRKERIGQLEIENKVLKIELTNTANLSEPSRLLLGVAQEHTINPANIDKFLYIDGIFKYREYDEMMRTKKLTEKEFQDIMTRIFPDGNLHFSLNMIHIQISNYDGSRIDSKGFNHTTFINVEEIDDWIEKCLRLRKHSKIDKWNAVEGSWTD